jgi:hypothetical protein
MLNTVELAMFATSYQRPSGPWNASPTREFKAKSVFVPTTDVWPAVIATVPDLYHGMQYFLSKWLHWAGRE